MMKHEDVLNPTDLSNQAACHENPQKLHDILPKEKK